LADSAKLVAGIGGCFVALSDLVDERGHLLFQVQRTGGGPVKHFVHSGLNQPGHAGGNG